MSNLIETTQRIIDLCEFTADLYDSVKSIFEDEDVVDINSIKVGAGWVSNKYLIMRCNGITRDEVELLSSEIEDCDRVALDGVVELKNCKCVDIQCAKGEWYLFFSAEEVK